MAHDPSDESDFLGEFVLCARATAGQAHAEVGPEHVLLTLAEGDATLVKELLAIDDGTFEELTSRLRRRIGRDLICFLLHAFRERLAERRIRLCHDEDVVSWLLDQRDWQERHNQFNDLNRICHKTVAQRLEELLLAKRVKPGDEVRLLVSDENTLTIHVNG